MENLPEYGEFPIPSEMPGVAGVFIGGCVERGIGSRFRSWAHAHTAKGTSRQGWICFLGRRRVLDSRGRPSKVFWHEFAHISTGHGHDDRWRAKMHELGQPIPLRYTKRERGVTRSGHRHDWVDHGPSQIQRHMTEHVCSNCGAWKLKRAA